jgi:regulatory protein YycH of two-component signal transduction system YycFG
MIEAGSLPRISGCEPARVLVRGTERNDMSEEDERVVESHEEALSATAEAADVDPEELRERAVAIEFVDSEDAEERSAEAQ